MKAVVSGVAGFIGAHVAARLGNEGWTVVGFDNLSRRGTETNLEWLGQLGHDVRFERIDLREAAAVDSLLAAHSDADAIIHLGGQVAVTTSVEDPRQDFESNALGTLNLLEAARRHSPDTPFLFSSTNKVYGNLDSLRVEERNGRYAYADASGATEDAPLDFHSPYGCSKGAADQYVRDYARIYGLPTLVFRQSCIYGTRQFGVEDQGWVAWFTIAAGLRRPITVYGDGKQVRDVLWIDDLLDLYASGIEQARERRGAVYNVGGGPENTLSLLELLDLLREETGAEPEVVFDDWRPGDQRVFVAEVQKAERELGWRPTVAPRDGVRRLAAWVDESQELLRAVLG